jgi:hypothetical protein
MNPIVHISKLLTEDPDVFAELDQSLDHRMTDSPEVDVRSAIEKDPMDASEIDAEVETTREEDPEQEIADQVRAQREAEEDEHLQRAKLVKPQFAGLNQNLDQLETGIRADERMRDDKATALNQELLNMKSLLRRLEVDSL